MKYIESIEVAIFLKSENDELFRFKITVNPNYKVDEKITLNGRKYVIDEIRHTINQYAASPYNANSIIVHELYVKEIKKLPAEDSQEMIIFKKVCLESLVGPHSNSPYKSLGHVIQWMRAYGFFNYDLLQVGWIDGSNKGEVIFHGKLVATYIFDDQLQIPIFTFNKDSELYERCHYYQETYLNGLYKGLKNPYIDETGKIKPHA